MILARWKLKTTIFTFFFASMAFLSMENIKATYFTMFLLAATEKSVQKWLQNGHFGAYVRPSWPILTDLGAMLARDMLAHLEAMLAHLQAMLAHLGGYVGPSCAALGAYVGSC